MSEEDALEYFQLKSCQSGDDSTGSSPAPATLQVGGLVGCSTLAFQASLSLTCARTSQPSTRGSSREAEERRTGGTFPSPSRPSHASDTSSPRLSLRSSSPARSARHRSS